LGNVDAKFCRFWPVDETSEMRDLLPVTHFHEHRPRPFARATMAIGLVLVLAGGCARGYTGPKTLAAIGAALLVGGGTTWVEGARRDQDRTANVGIITTAVGAAAVIGAAGWYAASTACEEDPDCPRGEECKEIPALPGRVPYKQCMRRPGP
jgi:hypothetical protein